MLGRREFGITGVSALMLAAMQSSGHAADEHQEHGHDGPFDACAEACNDCQRACDACARHCAMLVAEAKKEHLHTLASCLDCAGVCASAAQIVARQGVFSKLICDACAAACAKCAEACESHATDKMMAACAKECRACEAACRKMVAMA